MPKPSHLESQVYALGGHDSETTLVPGLADFGPAHHMVLLLVTLARPIEPGLDRTNLMVESLGEAVEAHDD